MRGIVSAAATVFGLALLPGAAVAQSPAPPASAPTFSKDVAPIFYKNCVVCHRAGEIAPMSLLTFREARPFARAIAMHVERGTMPPWHADPAHGTFANDRRLSAAEKNTILQWINAGAPEGNPADLPSAPVFPDGWAIGQPDAVFALQEAYPVPASGTIDYKYFEVPTNFTEDKWIQAVQLKPGTPAVVHHIIVYARTPRPAPRPADAQNGQAENRPQGARRQPPFSFAPGMEEPEEVKAAAARQPTPNDRPVPAGGLGSFVGGFAPGQSTRVYAPGTAVRLPAGSTLIFQMHYTANGKAVTDRSSMALVFAKERPKQEVLIAPLVNQNFTLPAGSPNTQVDAEMTFNQDVTLWSMLPHTHVRGRRWEVKATYPDGRTEMLLAVPNYDFNWQTEYIFKEPLTLTKGTVLRSSAWYDNSRGNKSNPDPSIDVHWGEQTWEEMQFTALTLTLNPAPTPTAGQP